MITEWKPDIVIYHSPCDDGFASAFAAWCRWGDSVDYFPATYGKPPADVAGKHVLIVDFSYKRETLEVMAQDAGSIVILDHHKTAREDLAPFALESCGGGAGALCVEDVAGLLEDFAELGRPSIVAVFDMERSGARMTWDFCHFGAPPPELISFVEDRDLWRFTMPGSRAFSLWLRSHRYDFSVWRAIAGNLLNVDARRAILDQAIAIEGFYDQKIAEIVRTAQWKPINNVAVPVANCTWAFASDVAHALLEAYPDAPFAATWYDRGDGARIFSLRSEDTRSDVSIVARRYGGGGHRNAAGFEVPA